MYSFKIRDRQTSGPIRTLSADCVRIVTDVVLDVAQCVATASRSGRGTCMQFGVAHRQEGPAVSVHL